MSKFSKISQYLHYHYQHLSCQMAFLFELDRILAIRVLGRQTHRRRTVRLIRFGPSTRNKHMEHSHSQPWNKCYPFEPSQARRHTLVSHAQAEKRDKHQKESLSLQPIHETKVATEALVQISDLMPPDGFVEEQKQRKDDHVSCQEALGKLAYASRLKFDHS